MYYVQSDVYIQISIAMRFGTIKDYRHTPIIEEICKKGNTI